MLRYKFNLEGSGAMREHGYSVTKHEVAAKDMSRFNVRLEKDVLEAFRKYCKVNKVSAQQVCEEYIKELLGLDV